MYTRGAACKVPRRRNQHIDEKADIKSPPTMLRLLVLSLGCAAALKVDQAPAVKPVSYTHLTLPTKA